MLYRAALVSQLYLLIVFVAKFTAVALPENFAPPNNVEELYDQLSGLGFAKDGNADDQSRFTAVGPEHGDCRTPVRCLLRN